MVIKLNDIICVLYKMTQCIAPCDDVYNLYVTFNPYPRFIIGSEKYAITYSLDGVKRHILIYNVIFAKQKRTRIR